MILFLGLFSISSQTLNAQLSCPDYTICVEVDPENCNELRVTLNGVANLPILQTYFYIYLTGGNATIDQQATFNSFQSTNFGMHPWISSPPQVNPTQIRLTNRAPFNPFTSSEECIHLGNIVLNPPEEGGCNDIEPGNITLGYYFESTVFDIEPPLVLGTDLLSNFVECYDLLLDCPCSEEICPEDWGICFDESGECGIVEVSITGLQGEDLAGMTLTINLDPNIPSIDEQATEGSFQSSFFGLQAWDFEQITFNGNQISIQLSDNNNSYQVPNPEQFLMEIYFERDPGECYSFSETTLSPGLSGGVSLGNNINDSEFCSLPGLSCDGFELCCVTLGGNVFRSFDGQDCDQGINYGFPEGIVEISSPAGNFNTTTVETDEFGDYKLEVYENESYMVRPDYTADFLVDCGLNTADIAEIQDFILGLLPCFYHLDVGNAAANLNNDSRISGADIILLRQIILGIPTSEPVNTWQFMTEADYVANFQPDPCPDVPIPFYNHEDVVNITTNSKTDVDFLAFKMGDVNGDCQQCLDPNALWSGGGNVDLIAKWNKNRNGIVFSLDDPLLDGISVMAVVVDGVGLHDEVIASFAADKNSITSGRGEKGVGMVWSSSERNGVSLDKDQTIMEIPLDSSIQNLSDLNLELSVGEMMMNGQRYLFNLIVEEDNEKEGDASWSVYPNPALDFLNLQGPSGQVKGEYMDMEIMNANGQTVYVREGINIHNDGNRISVGDLTSGMYILRLRTADGEFQLPFVKMRP